MPRSRSSRSSTAGASARTTRSRARGCARSPLAVRRAKMEAWNLRRSSATPPSPTDPRGGNPAGVVLDAGGMTDDEMQRIAAEVDYAETAFVTGFEDGIHVIRYFSPIAEVPFCGHATIATAVAIAERDGVGEIRFLTPVGEIPIVTDAGLRDAAADAAPTRRAASGPPSPASNRPSSRSMTPRSARSSP